MNVVLIGASSSIGPAVVERFREAKHRVVTPSRQECDFSDAQSILVFGLNQVDVGVLVILAGILPGKSLIEYGANEIKHVMLVNFVGPAILVRELIPRMTKGSRVLFVSSIAAQGSFDPIYAASKAALEGFVRSMARSQAARTQGICFNALAPGLIEGSGMYEEMKPERRVEHVRETPTGRLTTIREVAAAIFDLSTSEAWANASGRVFSIDGGRGCA